MKRQLKRSKNGKPEIQLRNFSSPFIIRSSRHTQFKTGIYLLPFATSLSSIRVYRFGWEGTMAKFHEQLKEKAKELHLKEKAIELKILLKKGAKIVGKKCKKGWSKVKKMAS
ncbi:hypothetical protein QQ045_026576 [Rhodiola kirilowii]